MNISKPKLLTLIVISIFSFSFFVSYIFACGNYEPIYIYTPESIEAESDPSIFFDTESFLNSRYEIISTGWYREYLYPVYRDLTGNKINQQEKEQLSLFYNIDFYDVDKKLEEAITYWREARKLVTKEDISLEKYQCVYDCNLNCLPHAFVLAADTLKERSKIYNSEELKVWLDGQDKVFLNCGNLKYENLQSPNLSAPTQESVKVQEDQEFFVKIWKTFLKFLNTIIDFFRNLFIKKTDIEDSVSYNKDLLNYDQEYQKAAAAFYSDKLDEAEAIFKKIADNKDSPWRAYATLSLGRTYIRKGGIAYEKASYKEAVQMRKPYLDQARAIFENALKDDSLELIHDGATSLLNYVNFRIDPEKRFKEAEEILLTPQNPKEIVNSLNDFSLLYRKFVKEEKYILENGGDLAQWIYVWKDSNVDNLEFALEKYQKTKSLPWLLASLKLMTPDHSSRDKIIKESLKISKDSLAYFTANYYRLKLLIKMGANSEEINKDIDSIIKIIPEDAFVAKNYFNDLKMLASTNLIESLSHSFRRVVAVSDGWDYSRAFVTESELIDYKMKKLFNQSIPLAKWAEIALSDGMFSPEIMKQIRLITFIRAIMLENFEIAEKISNILVLNDPTLKEDLSDFLKSKNDSEKEFTAALFILEHYQSNYAFTGSFDDMLLNKLSYEERDDLPQDNWWCWQDTNYSDQEKSLIHLVSPEDIETARLENIKLNDNNLASNYLSNIVIKYALENPNDLRLPEALHLAVLSTKHCQDSETSNLSRKAFRMLHDNYPDNYWTEQTPYWY